jgi:hypothetical protein
LSLLHTWLQSLNQLIAKITRVNLWRIGSRVYRIHRLILWIHNHLAVLLVLGTHYYATEAKAIAGNILRRKETRAHATCNRHILGSLMSIA